MSRLLLPFADQHVEIPSLSAGNIALTVGLKQVLSIMFNHLFVFKLVLYYIRPSDHVHAL